jgi:rhodanese-related sulfurtransferase
MKIKLVAGFYCFFIVSFLNIHLNTAFGQDNLDFPLRTKYSQVSPIETAELVSIYSQAILIDARNKMEFDVIHMDGAQNINSDRMNEGNLLSLRSKDSQKPLVFYCNGTTCSKSYVAAAKAVEWGFKAVRVYDSGILYWAKKQPQMTLLFGEKLTPQTIKTKLISEEKFAAALLPPSEFIAKAKSGTFTVIDTRNFNEQKDTVIDFPKTRKMPGDTIASLLTQKSWAIDRANLLVMDNVGKDIRWLQYYFEKEGVKNYYFLKGGVRQWIADGYDAKGNKK